MFRKYLLIFTFTIVQINSFADKQSFNYHHSVVASIEVENHSIHVTDSIKIPESLSDCSFSLNSEIIIDECNATLKNEKGDKKNIYKVASIPASRWLVIKYLAQFQSETGSTIGSGGVYISAENYWLPHLNEGDLFTFNLQLKLPIGWKGVTNGRQLTLNDTENIATYSSEDPTNQIIITANQWTVYSRPVSGVIISVFLINPDEALAQKYLGVTGQYLKMYSERIGSFPYSKFDVVENFRETGFGLPSFTLLGQKVMRFPWILFTSYPHELLHNYWGNGVYVDYEKGNWCEGITTYMADLMLKEQKKGEEVSFRRDQLQKYTNYANNQNDFPARTFVSKTDEVSEAVGYSKVVMLNQMLRTQFGDEQFFAAYANFYKENKFKRASFEDIQEAFEKETGADLGGFFKQWLDRTGAPEISVYDVKIKKKRGGWKLSYELQQEAKGEPYQLNIPVKITFDNDGDEMKGSVKMFKDKHTYSFEYDKKPIKVEIDPDFELMRALSATEVPATLSKLMGNRKWTVVLPSGSALFQNYRIFAETWKAMYGRRGFVFDIVEDNNIDNLPAEQSVWILGKENRWFENASIQKAYGEHLSNEFYENFDRVESKGVYAYCINSIEKGNAVGVINAQSSKQLMPLMQKMMHYGNNSYIGFEGDELNNTMKGQFPVIDSPLVVKLK